MSNLENLEKVKTQINEIEVELEALKADIRITGENAERAQRRIDKLETRFNDISASIELAVKSIGEVKDDIRLLRDRVAGFGETLGQFSKNLFQLIFMLIIFLGGLIGVKLVLPQL